MMMFPWELEVTTPALTPELTASKPTPGDCLTRELGTSGTESGTDNGTVFRIMRLPTGLSIVRRSDIARVVVGNIWTSIDWHK